MSNGFEAFSYSVGNYNVPYLYFIAFISYFDVPDLLPLQAVFHPVGRADGLGAVCVWFVPWSGNVRGALLP